MSNHCYFNILNNHSYKTTTFKIHDLSIEPFCIYISLSHLLSPYLLLYHVCWCLCSYNNACSLVQLHIPHVYDQLYNINPGKPAETLRLCNSKEYGCSGVTVSHPLFSVSWFAWRDVVNKNRKPQRKGGNAACKMKFHQYLMIWHKYLERLNVSSPGKKLVSVIITGK